ncbi:MAG TPA: response regulator transcription factor [Aggregatilineaceae bacterium]|nr:response regulator transcription factor [Aggregatilineaceae bacterium]
MTYQVLMIEDDPGIAGSLQTALIREGYSVHWKADGTSGVNYARDHNPHVIILDVRLPDGSGFDFCRQMRLLGIRQPIIMLTVESDEMDKVIGLEMGADDYMTKPFSLRELLSRVRAQLRRAYGELALGDSDMLYAGDLVIDRRRGNVSRGEKMITVSPTELRLLTYLAQHPNQVLTRGQILEAVWGYDNSPETEQVVTVNIRRLREKIELDPGQPELLLTVSGIGYKLTS